jgi:hypothetical protein
MTTRDAGILIAVIAVFMTAMLAVSSAHAGTTDGSPGNGSEANIMTSDNHTAWDPDIDFVGDTVVAVWSDRQNGEH